MNVFDATCEVALHCCALLHAEPHVCILCTQDRIGGRAERRGEGYDEMHEELSHCLAIRAVLRFWLSGLVFRRGKVHAVHGKEEVLHKLDMHLPVRRQAPASEDVRLRTHGGARNIHPALRPRTPQQKAFVQTVVMPLCGGGGMAELVADMSTASTLMNVVCRDPFLLYTRSCRQGTNGAQLTR